MTAADAAERRHGEVAATPDLAIRATMVLNARKAARRLLTSGLSSDPALDFLLELFLAGRQSRRMSVSALATVGNTPMTSGLRWIKRLSDARLVERQPDPDDGRRAYLRLTEKARRTIEIWLADHIPLGPGRP